MYSTQLQSPVMHMGGILDSRAMFSNNTWHFVFSWTEADVRPEGSMFLVIAFSGCPAAAVNPDYAMKNKGRILWARNEVYGKSISSEFSGDGSLVPYRPPQDNGFSVFLVLRWWKRC